MINTVCHDLMHYPRHRVRCSLVPRPSSYPPVGKVKGEKKNDRGGSGEVNMEGVDGM